MRTLSTLTLLAAATAALHATDFTDVHTAAGVTAQSGNGSSYTFGVSGDGTTSVGYSGSQAYKIVGTTYTALGNLPGCSSSYAFAASYDGSTIVGYSWTGTLARPYKWTLAGGMVDLGDIGGGTGNALGVSADGTKIVGYSYNGSMDVASLKVGSGATSVLHNDLLTGYSRSEARGITVVGGHTLTVGWADDTALGVSKAFLVNDAAITWLTDPTGDGMKALAISANGQVIVGDRSINIFGDQRGFVYQGGTVTTLTQAGWTESHARAVNATGSVVVGQCRNASNKLEAFKYQDSTITTLGFLGTGDESDAWGVSADGTVIVGYSRITAGGAVRHAFVYTNVMLDETEWLSSLNGPSGLVAMTTNLNQQPLEGAHHRPLMSYDSMGKSSQAWATGDFGASSRQSDRHMTSGEMGVSGAFGDFVLGVAAGHASLNQDLLFGGNASISGNYLLGEADYRLADKESILSLVLMRGDYDASAARGYVLGGGALDASVGRTGLKTTSARLRLDGPAQKFVSAVSATPFVSYTATRTTADAYQEAGGSFPASFAAQEHTAKEGRLGVTAKYVASPSTTLLFTAEWIHRFDDAGDGLVGTNVATASAFAVAGIAPTANQARFGFDVDHKLSADTLLNFSVHAAGIGPSSDVSAALSVRRAF